MLWDPYPGALVNSEAREHVPMLSPALADICTGVSLLPDTGGDPLDGRVLPMYLLDPEPTGVGDPPPTA